MDERLFRLIKIDDFMKKFFFALLLVSSLSSCHRENKMTIDFGKLNPNDFEIYIDHFVFDDYGYPVFSPLLIDLIYKDGVFYAFSVLKGTANCFHIIYKGEQQCTFYHPISGSMPPWKRHKYKLKIYENQGRLYCKVKIKGKYGKKETVAFTSIEEKWADFLKTTVKRE